MMNPEMMRLAQEKMSRMSPDDVARMQQQVMSNPDLIRLASESMKNMTAEDFKRAAQQLNQTSPQEMRTMTEKIASAKPEEFAAMKAQANAQMSYAISGAKILKRQGNELHGRGQYTDAAAKYKLAKDNLKSIPSAAAQALQLQCALNLMSCYRRGQAYRELGNLEHAVADLSRAHAISQEDETIAEALRDMQAKLANLPKRVVIEEIEEEDVVENNDEIVNKKQMDQPSPSSPPSAVDMQDIVRDSMKDPAMRGMIADMMKNISPWVLVSQPSSTQNSVI